MSALDAFLWTLTAWMWLLMIAVVIAVGVTVWEDIRRRRSNDATALSDIAKKTATLHVIHPEAPKESERT